MKTKKELYALAAAHHLACVACAYRGWAPRACVYGACGNAALALAADPAVSVAGILACAWATCAALAVAQQQPLAALQAVAPAVAWMATADQRRLAREVIAWTVTSRLACVHGAKMFSRLGSRRTPSEAMAEVTNESFYLVEQNIAEQRSVLLESELFHRGQLSRRLPFLFASLALNILAGGLFWRGEPNSLGVYCLGTLALAVAVRVPNAIVPESELGSASAAVICERSARAYAWAAGVSFFTALQAIAPRRLAYVVVVHAAGAHALSEKNPFIFLCSILFVNSLV